MRRGGPVASCRMNSDFYFIAFALFAGSFLVVQAICAGKFVRALRVRPGLSGEEESCREAVVILCLRGRDPDLPDTISGLLRQDYPSYSIRFVIDHPEDPAMETLVDCLSKSSFTRYEIMTLRSPGSRCSLKCSSLVQAVADLDSSVHFVAQLDADTIPGSRWLRDLAAALAPADVGAASGNRWYAPQTNSTGSLMRYFWNAGAVVQMYCFRIVWGGSMAIKTEAIRRAALTSRWSESLTDDTLLFSALRSVGLKVAFVPALLMVNREEITREVFQSWVARQLLLARLYHPRWIGVVGQGALLGCILAGAVGGIALCLVSGEPALAVLYFGVLVAFQIGVDLILRRLEAAVATKLQEKGESVRSPRRLPGNRFAFYRTMLLTQWSYLRALASAMTLRRLDWRGIEYEVNGPQAIRMTGYQPGRECPGVHTQPGHSL